MNPSPKIAVQADQTKGWLFPDEGPLLFDAGIEAWSYGPLPEVGSYCGKSALWLGHAAEQTGNILWAVDHHRGSPEMQLGHENHDADVADELGRIDTLPTFRRTIALAGLLDSVVPVVGESLIVANHWRMPLGLVFIDASHEAPAVHGDVQAWERYLVVGGLMALHDCSDVGPLWAWDRLLETDRYEHWRTVDTLRISRRVR